MPDISTTPAPATRSPRPGPASSMGMSGSGRQRRSQKLSVAGNAIIGQNGSLAAPYSTFTGQNNAYLQIYDGTSVSGSTHFAALNLATNQTTTGSIVGAIYFTNANLGSSNNRIAQITGGTEAAGTNDGHIHFSTTNNGTLNTAVRVTYNGYVGIGTTSAAGQLDVESLRNLCQLFRQHLDRRSQLRSRRQHLERHGLGRYISRVRSMWAGNINRLKLHGMRRPAGSNALSAITSATTTNSIDNGHNWAQTWTWNSLSLGTAFTISSNSMTTG